MLFFVNSSVFDADNNEFHDDDNDEEKDDEKKNNNNNDTYNKYLEYNKNTSKFYLHLFNLCVLRDTYDIITNYNLLFAFVFRKKMV